MIVFMTFEFSPFFNGIGIQDFERTYTPSMTKDSFISSIDLFEGVDYMLGL